MTYLPRIALALLCAVPLGACNTTAQTQASVAGILANPANVTPAQIQAALATADPTLAAKINTVAAQATVYVQAACGILPLASSLAAIAAAAYGASGAVLPATQIASAFCAPYTASATAGSKVAAVRRVKSVAAVHEGAVVSRSVEIGGIVVPATGTVVDPSKIN